MRITTQETDDLIALLLTDDPKPADASLLKPAPTALVRVPVPVIQKAEEGSLKRSAIQVEDLSSWLPATSYFTQQLMYHDRLLFKKVLSKPFMLRGAKKGVEVTFEPTAVVPEHALKSEIVVEGDPTMSAMRVAALSACAQALYAEAIVKNSSYQKSAWIFKANKEGEYILHPLHLACKFGLSTCIAPLIEAGADPNALDNFGRTALHVLALLKDREQQVAIAKKLCKKADMNRPDKEGRTPITFAIEKDAYALLDFLLDHGADPNANDVAATKQGLRKVRRKEDREAEKIKSLLAFGSSPLWVAARDDKPAAVWLLLHKRAKIKAAEQEALQLLKESVADKDRKELLEKVLATLHH